MARFRAGTTNSSSNRRAKKKYPPRPRNCFICFSSSERGREARRGIRLFGEYGPATARAWKALRPEERAVYEEMAESEEREHKMLYPDYKFTPLRKNKRYSSRKLQKDPRTVENPHDIGVSAAGATVSVVDNRDGSGPSPRIEESSGQSSPPAELLTDFTEDFSILPDDPLYVPLPVSDFLGQFFEPMFEGFENPFPGVY